MIQQMGNTTWKPKRPHFDLNSPKQTVTQKQTKNQIQVHRGTRGWEKSWNSHLKQPNKVRKKGSKSNRTSFRSDFQRYLYQVPYLNHWTNNINHQKPTYRVEQVWLMRNSPAAWPLNGAYLHKARQGLKSPTSHEDWYNWGCLRTGAMIYVSVADVYRW